MFESKSFQNYTRTIAKENNARSIMYSGVGKK